MYIEKEETGRWRIEGCMYACVGGGKERGVVMMMEEEEEDGGGGAEKAKRPFRRKQTKKHTDLSHPSMKAGERRRG